MAGSDTARSTYSRREFIAASGRGIAGAAIASLLAANMTGCGSKAAAADSGMWEAVRLNDFTLNDGYVYVNNSTLGTTLKVVRERMAQVSLIFAEGCYLASPGSLRKRCTRRFATVTPSIAGMPRRDSRLMAPGR